MSSPGCGGERGAECGRGLKPIGARGEVAGDEAIPGAGDPAPGCSRRGERDRAAGVGGRGGRCSIGHDGALGAEGTEGEGGGVAVRERSPGQNLGLLPVTGLPLPLMSYGGNSLMSSLVILGLLVRCSLESTGLIGAREGQASRSRRS